MSNNGWISVEDRLPDFGGYYLVAFSDGRYMEVLRFVITTHRRYWKGDTFLNEKHITHWQPLPPPPEATP